MPALNEEKNILAALDSVLAALNKFKIKGEIVVVNDGSRDTTPSLVREKIKEFPDKIRMVEHANPQGIGASFWDGVSNSGGDIVCMLPGDNENIPDEILRYVQLTEDVDIVIPFVVNKSIRSTLRVFLSSLFRLVINATFLTSFNYTNGTVLYRKSVLENLNHKTKGFFFQTDILVRLVKQGYLFAEVPYKLKERRMGGSKAITWSSLGGVVLGYLRLARDIYFKRTLPEKFLPSDSCSAGRLKG